MSLSGRLRFLCAAPLVPTSLAALLTLAPGCGLLWQAGLDGADAGSGGRRDGGAPLVDAGPEGDAATEPGPDAGEPISRAACTLAGVFGCYLFEDNVLDSSGRGNHASVTTPTFQSGALGGRALDCLEDDSAKIPFTSDFETPDFSVDFWFQIASVPESGTEAVLLHWPSRLRISLEPDRSLRVATASGTLFRAEPQTVGAWVHLGITAAGGEVRFYLDGAFVGAVTGIRLVPSGEPIGIGEATVDEGGPFIGRMDTLRFHGRALTAAEVCTAAGHTICATTAP